MGVDAAWARAMSASFTLTGVPITVTRAAPDDAPILTRGIWLSPTDDQQPIGRDFYRREPRKVLRIPRSDVLGRLDKGTRISAPEFEGQAIKTWQVEGYLPVQFPDEWRVILTPIA